MPSLAHSRRSRRASLLGVREVAELMAVSPWTVRRYVADGTLTAIRFHSRSRLRFRREDVERLLAGSPEDGAPAPRAQVEASANARGEDGLPLRAPGEP